MAPHIARGLERAEFGAILRVGTRVSGALRSGSSAAGLSYRSAPGPFQVGLFRCLFPLPLSPLSSFCGDGRANHGEVDRPNGIMSLSLSADACQRWPALAANPDSRCGCVYALIMVVILYDSF